MNSVRCHHSSPLLPLTRSQSRYGNHKSHALPTADFGQRLRHAWSELRLLKNEVKVDLSAVPQLGRYRQKVP